MNLFEFGVPGLFKQLSSFMHPEKGYEKAQNQLDKYYPEAQSYLQPYNQHGQEAYGNLNTAMQDLMNPSGLYDRFMNDYQMSDAAKYNQERATNSGLNALSAMGMLGSTPGLQALQAGTSQIGAQDEMNYMKQMIDLYTHGAGLAQGIYGQGQQAAGQLGQNATNMGTNSANMAYGRQNAPGEMFGGLLKAGMGMAGGGSPGGWSTTGGMR